MLLKPVQSICPSVCLYICWSVCVSSLAILKWSWMKTSGKKKCVNKTKKLFLFLEGWSNFFYYWKNLDLFCLFALGVCHCLCAFRSILFLLFCSSLLGGGWARGISLLFLRTSRGRQWSPICRIFILYPLSPSITALADQFVTSALLINLVCDALDSTKLYLLYCTLPYCPSLLCTLLFYSAQLIGWSVLSLLLSSG